MASWRGLTRYDVSVSHDPCPHCGADRVYGVPADDPDAFPVPATCACGAEGPPNLPYDVVAEKVHEASCASFDEKLGEFTCRCGQLVVRGVRDDKEVITHKMPQCRAFLDYDFKTYMAWVKAKPN